MKWFFRALALACVVVLANASALMAQAPAQRQQPEFIKQGQQLIRQAKPDDALQLYKNVLKTTPDSVPANIEAGSVLDLMGKGEEARKYFGKAIQVAETSEDKASAKRAMAISYAFEGKCPVPFAKKRLAELSTPNK